jgi:hypothetical protein
MAGITGMILVCSLVVRPNLDLCTSENALEAFRIDGNYQSEQESRNQVTRVNRRPTWTRAKMAATP